MWVWCVFVFFVVLLNCGLFVWWFLCVWFPLVELTYGCFVYCVLFCLWRLGFWLFSWLGFGCLVGWVSVGWLVSGVLNLVCLWGLDGDFLGLCSVLRFAVVWVLCVTLDLIYVCLACAFIVWFDWACVWFVNSIFIIWA